MGVTSPIVMHLSTEQNRYVYLESMFSPRVGGGAGYPREIDSASFPLGREFDY